jgi:hypothetical protein
MNTLNSLSKKIGAKQQRTLTIFRMNTYEKQAGWGDTQSRNFPPLLTSQGLCSLATNGSITAVLPIRQCRMMLN